MPEEKRADSQQLGDVAQYLGYGMTLAMSTALFLVGGYLLDRWLGTLPLFLIVGTFVGAGAGFYSLYFHMVVQPRQRSAADESGSGERPGT